MTISYGLIKAWVVYLISSTCVSDEGSV